MVGPVLRICAEQFHVNKLFVGVDGFSEKYGFMADNHLRVQAVRDMAAQADQVIVLTESEKFGRQSVVRLNLGEKITTVVTDSEIDAARAGRARARAHRRHQGLTAGRKIRKTFVCRKDRFFPAIIFLFFFGNFPRQRY